VSSPHLPEEPARFLQAGEEEGIPFLCMACEDQQCDFKPMKMKRRALGAYDVLIDMKFCGVCHTSDDGDRTRDRTAICGRVC
jgi:hypothetical protein